VTIQLTLPLSRTGFFVALPAQRGIISVAEVVEFQFKYRL
jgi:hypothetical protein